MVFGIFRRSKIERLEISFLAIRFLFQLPHKLCFIVHGLHLNMQRMDPALKLVFHTSQGFSAFPYAFIADLAMRCQIKKNCKKNQSKNRTKSTDRHDHMAHSPFLIHASTP